MEEVNYETFWDNNESHSKHPSVRLRNRFIKNTLLKLKFETLTDVGCGDGVLIKTISDLFPSKKYSASDFSSKVIEMNRERYPGIDFFTVIFQKNRILIIHLMLLCAAK